MPTSSAELPTSCWQYSAATCAQEKGAKLKSSLWYWSSGTEKAGRGRGSCSATGQARVTACRSCRTAAGFCASSATPPAPPPPRLGSAAHSQKTGGVLATAQCRRLSLSCTRARAGGGTLAVRWGEEVVGWGLAGAGASLGWSW